MDWIKRNLVFVIGAVVALVLLGGAGWYFYSKLSLNNQKWESLSKAYDDLKRLNQQNPHPGSGSVDNIKAAKEQVVELRGFQNKVRGSFQKIPPIPDLPKITDRDFSFALSRTINTLRGDATNFGVSLPPEYAFSFLAEISRASFQPGSLEPLSVQLGEVKAICDVLFQAKINALDFLRRERAVPEDAAGSATDYIADKSITNEQAVVTPYELTFRCFSPELASVLGNFASSPHTFIVKTINVDPEGAVSGMASVGVDGMPTPPGVPSPYPPGGESRYGESRYGPSRFGPGTAPTPAPAPAARGALPTVLDEKKLRVTIALSVVKLLPPKESASPPPRRPAATQLPDSNPSSLVASASERK
jgi:hypothetical protein